MNAHQPPKLITFKLILVTRICRSTLKLRLNMSVDSNDCDSSRDVENMSNSSFSIIINDKLKKTNGHNRRRSSNTKNIILTISQGELNAIDQERNKLIQSVAHLEEQNNLLRLQNEELIAQIDTGEEQKKNIVDEVAHLRTSLVVTNTVATEL